MVKSAFALLFVTLFAVLLRGGTFALNFREPMKAVQEIARVVRSNTSDIAANMLTYNEIRIRGVEYHSEGEILRLTHFDVGTPVWRISPFEVEERLKRLSWIERAKIRTALFPLRLEISLEEAEPWLVAELKDQSWIVSRTGRMIQALSALTNAQLIMESLELPRLRGVETSDRLEAAVVQIRFIERAGGAPEKVERYTLLPKSGGLVTAFSDGGSGTIGRFPVRRAVFQIQSDEDAKDSLLRLAKVADDLKRRGEAVEIADIRFKNQVVLR